MKKLFTIVVIFLFLLNLLLFPTHKSKGEEGELSVVDATDISDTIIKGDTIHFIAQVQTDGEIKYSGMHRTGTYITLIDEANSTYTFQYKRNDTEMPFANFFRLHLKLNTGDLSPGAWHFIHHMELESGATGESARAPFSIRESDAAPIIDTITPRPDYVHTTNDEIVFSANITDPDGDRIVQVEIVVNDTNYIMSNDGGIYTKYIGRLHHTIESYNYSIKTTRKKDGDNNWTYVKTFPINIIEGELPLNDTLPDVKDLTNIPPELFANKPIMFQISYKDAEGDPPDKIMVSIFNSSTDTLIFSGNIPHETGTPKKGAIYERRVDLTTEGITVGDWMYRIEYTYNGTEFTLVEMNFHVKEGETPQNGDDPQPVLIVLVILITIVILLALFVFTFGKRDPY